MQITRDHRPWTLLCLSWRPKLGDSGELEPVHRRASISSQGLACALTRPLARVAARRASHHPLQGLHPLGGGDPWPARFGSAADLSKAKHLTMRKNMPDTRSFRPPLTPGGLCQAWPAGPSASPSAVRQLQVDLPGAVVHVDGNQLVVRPSPGSGLHPLARTFYFCLPKPRTRGARTGSLVLKGCWSALPEVYDLKTVSSTKCYSHYLQTSANPETPPPSCQEPQSLPPPSQNLLHRAILWAKPAPWTSRSPPLRA